MLADPVSRLEESVAAVIPLIPLLELALVPDGSRRAPSPVPRCRSGSPSRPPWSPAPGMAVTAIHAGALAEERELREAAALPPRPRGTGSRGLPLALRALPPLAALPLVPPPRQALAASRAASWLSQARQALGLEDPWRPVPRPPGAPSPRCPWCGLPSLRAAPSRGLVRCTAPSCRDEDGERPQARLAAVRVQGSWQWQLWWRDGSEGLAPRATGSSQHE